MGIEDDGSVPPMKFEQVSFSHPITINYTSGSTGLPKGIIHGSSVLISVANNDLINFDTDRESRWLSVMPAGTAMWLMHLTVHFLGQTLVLYEGAPYFLSPTSFWDLLERQTISHILMFPNAMDEMQKRNYFPTMSGTITNLKTFDFLLKHLKHVAVSGAFGSTELMNLSLLKDTTLPTNKGEINVAPLGMPKFVFDKK
ncbi:acetoacetyl-CoA synthetase, partial [Nephila pilipes]